jgi:hypothetical protein
MLKKWMTATLAVTMLVPTLTACTDHEQIKKSVQQAISKQTEMKSYKFAGSADLKLGFNIAAPDGNPLTAALLSSFKDSKIEWSGTSSTDPVQFEADLKLTPAGSGTIAVPILIKDSKMYFNLPAINKPDEYYVIDMTQLGKDSKTPLSPDNLKNASQVSAALWTKFAGAIDAKWFEEAKDPVQLPDGKPAKSYSVAVSDKNANDINAVLNAKLPEVADVLQTNGLLSADQAAKWKSSKTTIQLKAPSKMTVLVDEQGFVRDEQLVLAFSLKNGDGAATDNQITLHEAYDQVNQPPQFQKDVPKQTKPFDDILKLLKPKK